LIEVREPAAPERVVGRFTTLDSEEIRALVARSAAAQRGWAGDAAARSRALGGWAAAVEADAASLAELLAREVGKPIAEARGEVARGVAILRYYAQAAFDPEASIYPAPGGDGQLIVERHPIGVVAAVCPWNFPVAIPLWKSAPALAMGNSVIVKPASAALCTALRLIELAAAHLPEGVLSMAPLSGSSVGELLAALGVQAVSFTGSVATGRGIVERAARRGIPVQAEMGGQNPAIVLADADLDSAAATIAGAAMSYAGQKCTATSRVIVERSVATRFQDLLVGRIEALHVGDPLADDTVVGPLISSPARQNVVDAVLGATSRGARLLAGGHSIAGSGWFHEPTLLEVGDPHDPVAQEETFGPIAVFMVADTADQACRIADDTPYGLVAAIYSRDVDRARRLAAGLAVGMVRINAPTTGVDYHVPFGGEKASSYGPREQGRAALSFYSRTRTVFVHR
jgi:alpha-ketoglutaric semialdehyde dehydrogenase